MKLKSVFTILMAAAGLVGSLFAQNKTSNSKETKMGKSLVVYFSLAGEQYKSHRLCAAQRVFYENSRWNLHRRVLLAKLGKQPQVATNTSIIAKFIAEETGSELFELETQKPYPTDSYSRLTQIAKDEQNKKARPALKADIDITVYDTIYIGYPNWWGDMPMPVYTFLEAHGWKGKTIIPFCTHEGSGLSGTESRIRSTCKGATVEKGLAVQGKVAQTNRSAAKKSVQDWLAKLGK